MIPKKARDFNKLVAEELNLPESVVEKIADFYWESVRKKMSNLADPAIEIINFGTFKVKHWGIDEDINKFQKIIKAKEGKFKGYHIKVELEQRIAAMERIKSMVAEEKQKFKEIRQKRYAKQNQDNLEEQSSDMGRLQEPDIQD